MDSIRVSEAPIQVRFLARPQKLMNVLYLRLKKHFFNKGIVKSCRKALQHNAGHCHYTNAILIRDFDETS